MTLLSLEHRILARQGEQDCGDAVFVRREEGGAIIVVVDALGHGDKAADVARRAVSIASEQKASDGVLTIMKALHDGLMGSRGACALACVVTPGVVEVCSVGNVELRAAGMDVPFVLTAGVLGSRMVRPRVIRTTLTRPVRLALYSDGISSRFHLPDFASMSASMACSAIFDRQRRSHDDACLVIADLDADVPSPPPPTVR